MTLSITSLPPHHEKMQRIKANCSASQNDGGMLLDENDNEMWHGYYGFADRVDNIKEDLESAGSPVQPLDFPTPTVHRAAYVSTRIIDHRTGRVHDANIITRLSENPNNEPDRAYLFRKRLARTVYGSVRLCVVIRKRLHLCDRNGHKVEWKSTDEMVVLKASSFCLISKTRGRHLEDPLKEAACLQYVGNYHPNVLGCLEVLQDDNYLYTVMPYCTAGDLYSKIIQKQHNDKDSHNQRLDIQQRRKVNRQHEALVRCWFLQLLHAISHLQKKGVCHRDLCLENILLVNEHNLVVTDFGLSLRIPYNDDTNLGAISDVSEGYQRRLIKSQGQCGQFRYLAPEIVEGEEGFDGFAADLWSAGVILFVCLVGYVPFKWPHPTDFHYSLINQGQLRHLVKSFDIAISDEACDLLQNMFWRDPRRRLTLNEIMAHPWVVGPKLSTGKFSTETEGSKYPIPLGRAVSDITHKQQTYNKTI